jgi:ATP-dependent Zn protease
MKEWMSLATSWLPFLVLMGLWFWFSRKSGMQARTASGGTMIELYEQQVAECRRTNLILERIAASLEKRESRAE